MKQTTAMVNKARSAAGNAMTFARANPMTLGYIALGGAGIYIAYKLVTSLNKAADAVSDDPNAGGGNIDPGNAGNTQNGATITNAQAQTMASRMLAAMATVGKVNDDEFNEIISIFRGRNVKDFALISVAFGEPRRSIFTGEGSTWWLGGEKLNLSQWMALELDNEQKNKLSAVIPGIL